MSRTHEIFKSPVFFQLIQIRKGTPAIHRAIQSQEIDEPYRQAAPAVIRIPIWPTVHFYKTMHGDYYVLSVTVTFRKALVVGFWRKTGYEEHEALAHALNLNEEHANDQATDFESAAAGADSASTDLGKQAQPFTVRGNVDGGSTRTDES